MTFDITQFELNDTATLIVQDATGEQDLLVNGERVEIDLYGSGSAQYVKAEHKASNAAMIRMQAAFKGKSIKNASELTTQETAEKLASCTASIRNFPIEGGALALYSNSRLSYIKKQVIKFLEDDANFTKPSMSS